ncbi:MAG: hypothetical protein LC659_15585 [Myxococcales bacterium]|nr:hypothetical protein [Myxococcales bacterium]
MRDTGQHRGDQLAHLFDRFWQAKRADRQGARLGLAIAKAIVEAHQGSISVESRPGEGSCFNFVIPADPAEAVTPPSERRALA